LQSLYTTLCFLPPVCLTLTATPRVLGTCCCVLLLQMLCRMKKLIGGVKRAFSSSPSSRGSGTRSGDGSRDSEWSSSFVPSPHETMGSIRYLAHDDVPMATDGDNISICSTEEMANMILMLIFLGNWLLNKNLHSLNFLKMLGLEQPLVNSLILLLFGGWNMARNILMTYHKLGLL
jgi:hypothetical protein